MLCFRDGNCVFNSRPATGREFCALPRCMFEEEMRAEITAEISRLIRISRRTLAQKSRLSQLEAQLKTLTKPPKSK